MEKALVVKNLKKNFGRIEAVKSISFEIEHGEIFGLIGPNGAGKSTALRMIATILSPSEGTAKVYGYDIKQEPDKVRQIISYLPEEAGAYKNLTGIAYLQFMAALFSDDKKIQQEFVSFARQIANLGDRLNDKVGSYSKGMTRKLLLARAVMIKPRLAILDEPTSGLDVVNALEIRNIIRGLSKSGMSVLLSSHNMLEIEYLSERVAIIDKGRIHEIGKVAEIKQKYNARNLEEVFMQIVRPNAQ